MHVPNRAGVGVSQSVSVSPKKFPIVKRSVSFAPASKKSVVRRRNAAPLDGRRSARKFAAEKNRSAACDPALEAASLGLARQPVAVVAAALLVASWSRCRPRRALGGSRPRARRAAHVPLPAAVGVLASLAAARWRENRYAAACAPSSVASPTHPRCAPAAIIFDRYLFFFAR